MIASGDLIELQKISASADPLVEPGTWEGWVPGGSSNIGSLPVSYQMIGILLEPVRIGFPIKMLRLGRNGVSSLGRFTSSPVISIEETGHIETYNSIYLARIIAMGGAR